MSDTNPYPVIDKELCKGCQRCVIACPEQAIKISDKFNDAGYQYAYYTQGCVGCRDCYYTCPEPLAIEIHSFKKMVNDDISVMIKYKTREIKNE